jgi:uncharacterized protein YoxC
VYERIRTSFYLIGEEVKGLNSMLYDSQFRAVGPDQYLSNLNNSLLGALRELCTLMSEGDEIIMQINHTADATRSVASRLGHIMEDVQDMRQETRLQAVNTIIMASNLGDKGRTIQVLAKEISSLSDQTSELVHEVDILQSEVNGRVEKLCRSWEENIGNSGGHDLAAEVAGIDEANRGVEQEIGVITEQIGQTTELVAACYNDLSFLEDLQDRLRQVAGMIAEGRDLLEPWRDQASQDSGELEQLVQRYTMEQERLIHMFDRGDAAQTNHSEEDIFF